MLWVFVTVYVIIALSLLYPTVRRSYYSGSLVLGNIAVFLFLLVVLLLQSPSDSAALSNAILDNLAYRPVDLPSLRLQTLLTSMFLHLSFFHIIGNIIFLYLLGLPLEERIGGRAFVLIYLAGGGVATLFYTGARWGSSIPALGASGAIMAIAGALLVLYPRDEIPMLLGPIFLPRVRVSLAVGVVVIGEVLLLFLGVQDGVAHAAHVGGIVGGIFLGPLVRPRGISKPLAKVELADLATTEELRDLLKRIQEETVPEVRDAWIEHFAGKARCPECFEALEHEGNTLRSDCGWERRL